MQTVRRYQEVRNLKRCNKKDGFVLLRRRSKCEVIMSLKTRKEICKEKDLKCEVLKPNAFRAIGAHIVSSTYTPQTGGMIRNYVGMIFYSSGVFRLLLTTFVETLDRLWFW
jgi:hypothetical protein